MSRFEVKPKAVLKETESLRNAATKLSSSQKRLQAVQQGLHGMSGFEEVSAQLVGIGQAVEKEKRAIEKMESVLSLSMKQYELAEQNISGLSNQKAGHPTISSGSPMTWKDGWDQEELFEGYWWHDEGKFDQARQWLEQEAEEKGGIDLLALSNAVQQGDRTALLKLQTVQALTNALRSGTYDEQTFNALQNNLAQYGLRYEDMNHTLGKQDLEYLKERYDKILFKESGNKLEGGWGDVIEGLTVLSIGAAYTKGMPAEPKIENISEEGGSKALIDIDVIRPQLKTEPDTAFFWSGRTDGVGGAEVAADIAKGKGGVTLESTIESKNISMPEWDFNNPSTMEAWDLASGAYAEQVSGEIRAIVGAKLRPGNIWENIEMPRLIDNHNVTKIITIDPKTGLETIIFER